MSTGYQSRGRNTLRAREQCSPESFCSSGKFLRVERIFGQLPHIWESVCLIFRNVLKTSGFSDLKKNNYIQYSPRTFQIIGKVSRKSWLFPDNSEILQTVSNFLDCLETFQNVWKLLRMSGNFLILWKLTCLSENLRFFFKSPAFPENMDCSQTNLKYSRQSGKF